MSPQSSWILLRYSWMFSLQFRNQIQFQKLIVRNYSNRATHYILLIFYSCHPENKKVNFIHIFRKKKFFFFTTQNSILVSTILLFLYLKRYTGLPSKAFYHNWLWFKDKCRSQKHRMLIPVVRTHLRWPEYIIIKSKC